MVVLRLTMHGQIQPQNSPHGWAQKVTTHTCVDEHSYGCWTIVTPAWTEGLNYETNFDQVCVCECVQRIAVPPRQTHGDARRATARRAVLGDAKVAAMLRRPCWARHVACR